MHNDEVGIVTRSGARRLRWLAIAVAVPLFGVVAAFGTVAHVPEPVPVRTVVETLALSTTPVGDSGTIIYFQEDRFRRSDTLATLIGRARGWRPTGFSLGRWAVPVYVGALVYGVAMLVNILAPTGLNSPRGALFNYGWMTLVVVVLIAAVGLVYLAVARPYRRAPAHQPTPPAASLTGTGTP